MTTIRIKATDRPQDVVRTWARRASDADLKILRDQIDQWPDPAKRAVALAMIERPTRH